MIARFFLLLIAASFAPVTFSFSTRRPSFVASTVATQQKRCYRLQATPSEDGTIAQELITHSNASAWGGNFAGLLASFDFSTGELLALPRHYIPAAMVEWGAIPTALEVLSCESERKRTQTIVLPEIGCGVDNLETLVTLENVVASIDENVQTKEGEQYPSFGTVLENPKMKRKRIYEAYFSPTALCEGSLIDEDVYRCRVRVQATKRQSDDSFDYGPIEIIIERYVVEEGARNIADTTGGGLDGQSVGRWLGPLNSKKWKSFGEDSKASPTGILSLPLDITIETKPHSWLRIAKLHHATVQFDLSG